MRKDIRIRLIAYVNDEFKDGVFEFADKHRKYVIKDNTLKVHDTESGELVISDSYLYNRTNKKPGEDVIFTAEEIDAYTAIEAERIPIKYVV